MFGLEFIFFERMFCENFLVFGLESSWVFQMLFGVFWFGVVGLGFLLDQKRIALQSKIPFSFP